MSTPQRLLTFILRAPDYVRSEVYLRILSTALCIFFEVLGMSYTYTENRKVTGKNRIINFFIQFNEIRRYR